MKSFPEAILFDMDGTLVDSEKYWFRAQTELVSSYGAVWNTEQALTLVGESILTSAEIIIEATGIPLSTSQLMPLMVDRVIELFHTEGAPWNAGALEVLQQVTQLGIPTALVSSSYRVLLDPVLHSPSGHKFDLSVAGDEVTQTKPAPEPYLKAAAGLGVDITHCVVVEDSPPGIEAGIRSGAAVVGIPCMKPLVPQKGLSLLSSLEQLTPEVLQMLRAGLECNLLNETAQF